MNYNKEQGNIGEAYATQYLKKNKYKILELNYFTPLGEIDIIAKDGDTIVFVEVKTRSSFAYGTPQHAITPQKQRHIRSSALFYLKRHGLIDKVSVRFDAISVLMNNPLDYEIEHLENIF